MSSQVKTIASKKKPFRKAFTTEDSRPSGPKVSKRLDITPAGKAINFQIWEECEYKKAVSKYGAAVAAVIRTGQAPVVKIEPLPAKASKTMKALR